MVACVCQRRLQALLSACVHSRWAKSARVHMIGLLLGLSVLDTAHRRSPLQRRARRSVSSTAHAPRAAVRLPTRILGQRPLPHTMLWAMNRSCYSARCGTAPPAVSPPAASLRVPRLLCERVV